MEFEQSKHTKEFLHANPDVAFALAGKSAEFALSDLANDIPTLMLKNNDGWTVASILAYYQAEWLTSDAVKNTNVLALKNNYGNSVAHYLAQRQPEWLHSEESKKIEILMIKNDAGWSVAHNLAAAQSEWLRSEAANNIMILKLKNVIGQSVAHSLAEKQPAWCRSDAAKNIDVLRLKDLTGNSVAHYLALYQSEWLHTEDSKKIEILKIKNKVGKTVAHSLADKQPEWLTSEAAKTIEILMLSDNEGWSVAHSLANRQPAIIKQADFFRKQVLTQENNGKLLAEFISENYAKVDGMDVPNIAMQLISQGAAYKHSKPLALKVGLFLVTRAKNITEDNLDPLIALKQLQAVYATVHHQVEKIKSTSAHESLDKWQIILESAGSMLEQHLIANPDLFEVEHSVDIFCEPGDALLKRLASERNFKGILISANGIEPTAAEIHHEKGLY